MNSIEDIKDYHAHIYYDTRSKNPAESLRKGMEDLFPKASFGRWHDHPVGPHPNGSFQIEFETELFQPIISYLALNRGDLVVFVHPNTGDALIDHRDYAIWMGEKRQLNLKSLERPDS